MSKMFLVAAMVSLVSSSVHAAESMYGLFMVVKGDVQITDSKEKATAAKVGSRILPGESVVSGADSRAKIVMSDRNVINVSPGTKLKIEKYENDAKTGVKNVEINLIEGKVRNNVEQKYDDEKSKFQIKTPTAVAGVRGTQFVTGYNPSTQMTSIVTLKGAVTVAPILPGGGVGAAVVVTKGQSSNVTPTGGAEAPKAVPKEELNKVDKESTASNGNGDRTARGVANEGGPAPKSMVDKGDMNTATLVVPPPPPPPPPNAPVKTYIPPPPKLQKAKVTITPTH